MAERIVLGVDGGNTKTLAVAARTDGTIVGVGRSGCSDIYAASSVDDAMSEVDVAVQDALRGGRTRAPDLASCVFSMAGADWPEDIAFLQTTFAARGYGERPIVVNDAVGALRAGSPDGTGVSVVCGTGAAIGARAPDRREWHTSWWQEPQGSRQLADKTLRAVYRAELDLELPTALTDHVLRLFSETTVEAVLHRITRREGGRSIDHAHVTSVLLAEAALGDPVAGRIVREHGQSLGDYAVAAARRAGITESDFALVLSGGVFRNPGSLLPQSIITRVCESYPRVRPVVTRYEPVVGSLLLALEAAIGPLSDGNLRRLEKTLAADLVISL